MLHTQVLLFEVNSVKRYIYFTDIALEERREKKKQIVSFILFYK
mgnify:CR=1 FL=1